MMHTQDGLPCDTVDCGEDLVDGPDHDFTLHDPGDTVSDNCEDKSTQPYRSVGSTERRLKKAASLVKLLALAEGHSMHQEQAMEHRPEAFPLTRS
jgi:hypothetical protein